MIRSSIAFAACGLYGGGLHASQTGDDGAHPIFSQAHQGGFDPVHAARGIIIMSVGHRVEVLLAVVVIEDLAARGKGFGQAVAHPRGTVAEQGDAHLGLGNARGEGGQIPAHGLGILNLMPARELDDAVVGKREIAAYPFRFLPLARAAFFGTTGLGTGWLVGETGREAPR